MSARAKQGDEVTVTAPWRAEYGLVGVVTGTWGRSVLVSLHKGSSTVVFRDDEVEVMP